MEGEDDAGWGRIVEPGLSPPGSVDESAATTRDSAWGDGGD